MNKFYLLAAKTNQLAASTILKAGESDIPGKIKKLLTDGDDSVYGIIKQIATPIATVAIGFLALMYFLSPDPKGSDAAKKGLIAVVGALILLYLGPTFIDTIVGLLG